MSVSRSKLADVPFAGLPTVLRLPGALEALKLPAPLVKSSSTAHTPLTRPTSPVSVNTPRSREYQPFSRLSVMSGWPTAPVVFVAFLYAVVTKSTRPLIVTLGAGACAKLGGASVATKTTATTMATMSVLMASPRGGR